MSEALAAVYSATTLQTCIVHLIRHTLDFVNWKERKPLAKALRPIYTAASADAAAQARDDVERGPWGQKFPTVVASWRCAWTNVIPFFAFPPDVRRVVYTTNALESVHAQLRRSSRRAAISRMTRPRRNSCGWHCGTSPRSGIVGPTTGRRR